jgi:hypothetical protein
MFDYRYHAISLAAVLLALALGVLIGVAIGDSNLVSSAKNGIVHDLSSEVNRGNRQVEQLHQQLADSEAFANGVYPLAVRGTLAGRKIGLVFLGASSEEVNGFVRKAVDQAGGQLATAITVREPLDLKDLARSAAGTPYAALGSEPALAKRFGFRMGDQLIAGGQLITRLQASLLSSFDGQFGGLDGIVIERAEPEGMTPEAAGVVSEFQSGLISGFNALGVQTVGVELSSTEPSQITWYKNQGTSSVDDLNQLAGRAALALALAGARGAWGLKPSADALLPHLGAGTATP